MNENQTNTSRQSRFSVPQKAACGVVFFFLLVALLPYAVVGENWGMVWFYIMAPLSFFVESTVGIGDDSWLFIVAISLASAILWSALTCGACRLIQAYVR